MLPGCASKVFQRWWIWEKAFIGAQFTVGIEVTDVADLMGKLLQVGLKHQLRGFYWPTIRQ